VRRRGWTAGWWPGIFGGVALCAAFILVAAFFGDWLRYSGFWPTSSWRRLPGSGGRAGCRCAHPESGRRGWRRIAIDSDGVYLGGRPSTVIEWRGSNKSTASSTARHRNDDPREPYLVAPARA